MRRLFTLFFPLFFFVSTLVSAQGWLPVGSHYFGNGGENSEIRDVVEHNGDFYAVGGFASDLNSTISFVAKWNGTAWSQLGSGFQYAINRRVEAIAIFNNELYIGGNFVINNGTTSFANIARWDDANTKWMPVATIDPTGPVYELEVFGGNLYAGGDFNTMDGITANNIAKWSGTAWSALGTGLSTGAVGSEDPDQVFSMVVYDNKLIVGGRFTTAGGDLVRNIASWDGANWLRLGGTLVEPGGIGAGASGNKAVWEMVVFDNKLFVGGMFSQAYNTFFSAFSVTDHLAIWNGTTWSAANFAIGGSPHLRISAMTVFNNRIYVGSFNQAGVYSLDNTLVTGGWRTEPTITSRILYKPAADALYTAGNELSQLADPFPNFTYNQTTNCTGQPIQLTGQATSTNPVTSWSWTFTDANIPSSTEQNPVVTFSTAGAHEVTLAVTSVDGTFTKKGTITTKANTLPAPASFTTSTANVCQNQTNVSYIVNTVTDATSYTWSYSGEGATITGTTNSVTINFAAGATSGTLSASATNACATGTAITMDVTVNSSPEITTQPATAGTIGICGSNNLTLTTVATGTGLTYKWQYYNGSGTYLDLVDGVNTAATFKLGGTYSGAATATLTASGLTANTASATDPASYRVVISNAGSCSVNSSSANIRLYATPTISTQPNNLVKCAGSSGNVTFTTGVTSPPAGLTYQWQVNTGSGFANLTNDGVYSGVTTTTLTVASSGITNNFNGFAYRCVVGTCTPSVISSEATLTIESPPAVTAQPVAVTTCAGMDATFSVAASGTNISYQWQQRLLNSDFVAISDVGIYAGTSSPTLTLTGITTALDQSRYRCVLTSGTCNAVTSDMPQLLVRPIPTVTTQPVDRTLCEGSNTTFSVSVSNAFSAYRWQVDFTGLGFVDLVEGGVYSNVTSSALVITGATISMNGYKYRCRVGACTPETYSNAGTLTVNQNPAITESPVDQTVCAGEDATFSVTATGASLTYQWFRNGSMLTSATSATLTIPNASVGHSNTTYTCRVSGVTGSGSCAPVMSAEAKLTVNELVIASQPVNVAGFCPGGNATFSVQATGASPTYQWQVDTGSGFTDISNGGVYSNATTSILSITAAPFSMNGNKFRCVVGGLCASVNTNQVTLSVFPIPPKPVISVNVSSPDTPVLGTTGAQEYEWFKNGTLLTTASSIAITEEGSYTVKVKNNGCTSELSDPQVMIVTGDFERTNPGDKTVVYPNPTTSTVIVSLHQFKEGEIVQVALTDLLGRTVHQSTGRGGEKKELDVRSYQPGRFLITLQQGSLKIVSQFVKSN